MRWTLPILTLVVLPSLSHCQVFRLAPAVALEAEDFTVEKGWKVVKNGEGNYMVDSIGFNHISGERLLGIDAKDQTASAYHDVVIPVAGRYRLWVRYEYPAFCETRFRVAVEQGGKKLLTHEMGTKASDRYGFGDPKPKAQHDPSWGPEGLMDEAVTTPPLAAGKARIYLLGAAQPQVAGVAARRNIDLVYLTSDLKNEWLEHYSRRTKLYPILDAFRDTRGPRWEVRVTNRAAKTANVRIEHVYNRFPWAFSDPADLGSIAAGKSSEWVGLRGQDTSHFSMVNFKSLGNGLEVEIRPVGAKETSKKVSGTGEVRVYLPPYPGKGESPTTPVEAIDAILADLKAHEAPGKKPTLPLCYGGWMPLGLDEEYGRKYASLYSALGFRSLHPALTGPKVMENLKAVGIEPTRSWAVTEYRNPPTRLNIERATLALKRTGLGRQLRFFDYGDEIGFGEWMTMLLTEDLARAREVGKKYSEKQLLTERWITWLKANRPENRLEDYWLPRWGPITPSGFRPDSSAEAARLNPRLYVDSLIFYEDSVIRFAAGGARAVRAAFGDEVLCGANYSCHPFYYPSSTMYIKWFRGGAADLGRHSETFWQAAQLGPMVNGYVAEHFMAGMRDNPRAVLRQYTMPHAPGNTDANFLRSAYTHLAHGATMLDFFGVGLNESFSENHIDHRARSRFRAVRDVTHAVGFVEDLLPASRPVRSEVALLVSESTERWDNAGIATDRAGVAPLGEDFRKTRLHFHLERLGVWKALTFQGVSPDLITESDIIAGKLDGYKLVVVVGDHWAKGTVPALEKWVKAGGVVLGTAASGQRDSYGAASSEWHRLAGLSRVATETKTTFLRPRQELPYLAPLESITWAKRSMPVLTTRERLVVAIDVTVRAKFDDGSPAWTERPLGKGHVLYVAAHPGLAYLWSATQPAKVPDRGPGTHTIPTRWDAGASALIASAVEKAGATGHVRPGAGELLDARLLESPGGYIIPIANYNSKVGGKATLSVRTKRPIKRVVSAHHGVLPTNKDDEGRFTITIPELGYGDVLRLEVGKE